MNKCLIASLQTLKFFSTVQLIINFLYKVLLSSTVRGTKATTFLSKSPHKVLFSYPDRSVHSTEPTRNIKIILRNIYT